MHYNLENLDFGKMKIGLAQINSTVGDFSSNAKKVVHAYRQCLEQGADLVITPECSLIGYPTRDLLFKSRFVSHSKEVLEELAKEVDDVPLLVGYAEKRPDSAIGKPFSNSVAILHKGKVIDSRDKTLLPTYDVFDERRYYESAQENLIWEFKGKKIGITICEDIWTDEYLYRPLYEVDPVEDLVKQGAELILNLSASPFHLGKQEKRISLLRKVATEHHVPIAYCNSIGGNDQLVFDGGSVGITDKGEIAVEAKRFVEDAVIFDLSNKAESSSSESTAESTLEPMEALYQALILGLKDYAQKCGFSRACLGLSGGIDSALTAVLAVEAFGGDNVHGLTMPSPYSSEGSVNDSLELAKKLKMRCDRVEISATFDTVKKAMQPSFDFAEEDVTEENMQARIRGLYLMSLSNKSGALLLTTGNKSEMAVGYCTMYGDMCGGLAAISDVPKTMVYELARWINRNKEIIPWNTIEKPPSAELRPDQKDQDTLPEYDVLDDVLEQYVEQQLSAADIIAKGQYDENLIRWIQRRVDFNEWKRHQAAPGLRVTSKAFGIGRRMPLAQRFHA